MAASGLGLLFKSKASMARGQPFTCAQASLSTSLMTCLDSSLCLFSTRARSLSAGNLAGLENAAPPSLPGAQVLPKSGLAASSSHCLLSLGSSWQHQLCTSLSDHRTLGIPSSRCRGYRGKCMGCYCPQGRHIGDKAGQRCPTPPLKTFPPSYIWFPFSCPSRAL